MTILYWGKPEKAISIDEWKSIAADSAPPGVYSPNMSAEDAERWKAKYVGMKSGDPRVEIRKSFSAALGVFKVRVGSDGWPTVDMSFNGTAKLDYVEFRDLQDAVTEAVDRLRTELGHDHLPR